MYLTVDRTQHKRDSVSLKTFNKKYPNLDKEGKKKGKRTKQKRHVGQREKKKWNIFVIGVPEEEGIG